MSAPVRVVVECAWCQRILRAEVWPATPGVTDGDVSGAICPDCASLVAREAARCDDGPRDAWLYQPQPWGLGRGIAHALVIVGAFVAFGAVAWALMGGVR